MKFDSCRLILTKVGVENPSVLIQRVCKHDRKNLTEVDALISCYVAMRVGVIDVCQIESDCL